MAAVLPLFREPERKLERLRTLVLGEIPVAVETTEDDLSLQDRLQLAKDTAESEA